MKARLSVIPVLSLVSSTALFMARCRARGKPVQPAQVADFDAVFVQLEGLLVYRFLQEVEQAVNLFFGALPVFGGEAVEGEVFEAELAEVFNRRAHVFHARLVPFEAGQAALLRPAAVAVHNDGDVGGEGGVFLLADETAVTLLLIINKGVLNTPALCPRPAG